MTLLCGILACYVYITGGDRLIGTIFANVYPVVSGLFVLIYAATTILTLKLTDKSKKPKLYYSVMLIGIFITGILCLPVFATPITIQNAENEFASAYGTNWRSQIPDDVSVYFEQTPFNIPEYFMGTPSKDCDVVLDVLFHEEDGISLYFDVYIPKSSLLDLPGQYSTIINIHGGGWVTGDKGFANIPSVSRYLAAQGYVVFDIQYGLTNKTGILDMFPTMPEWNHKIGDFNISDQVRHIGLFTQYIDDHAHEYGANLNSTFILGRSAGAHLTGVVGFGYNDPYFADYFSEEITLKGIIPIYPPDDTEETFRIALPGMISGTPETNPLAWEKFQPSKLINSATPPVLIFQGTHDPWVLPSNSENIKNASNNNGVKCSLLFMHFSGHGSDYFSQGNYNQVFLYYLERFLYLNR
jgi:acetyl esterase/lipase